MQNSVKSLTEKNSRKSPMKHLMKHWLENLIKNIWWHEVILHVSWCRRWPTPRNKPPRLKCRKSGTKISRIKRVSWWRRRVSWPSKCEKICCRSSRWSTTWGRFNWSMRRLLGARHSDCRPWSPTRAPPPDRIKIPRTPRRMRLVSRWTNCAVSSTSATSWKWKLWSSKMNWLPWRPRPPLGSFSFQKKISKQKKDANFVKLLHLFDLMFNQSINQSLDESLNQSMNQRINGSINESLNH